MLFHSFSFFALFAVTFIVFWLLRKQKLRLFCLLIASCVFYMSWNPWFILLILFSTSVDYIVALRLVKTDRLTTRRALLIFSIAINLGILAIFKYANFAFATAGSLAHLLGLNLCIPMLHLILPLGISFY